MWSVFLFGLSLLGILTLVVSRNWRTRQSGFVQTSRPYTALDEKVVFIATYLERFPDRLQTFARTSLKWSVFHISAFMLRVVQFVERRLIRVINLVKGRGEHTAQAGSASSFLQNVATYKEKQPVE